MTTGNVRRFTKFSEIGNSLKEDIVIGIGINNGASVSEEAIIGGNSTDRALMSFLMDAKADFF